MYFSGIFVWDKNIFFICRLNILNEAVTHVILGEKIEKDISLLSSATFR